MYDAMFDTLVRGTVHDKNNQLVQAVVKYFLHFLPSYKSYTTVRHVPAVSCSFSAAVNLIFSPSKTSFLQQFHCHQMYL